MRRRAIHAFARVNEPLLKPRRRGVNEFRGPEVNRFVDHRQIVQLKCRQAGIWGARSL